MLVLVERRQDKVRHLKELANALERVWTQHETRMVTWRPDNQEMLAIHDNKYWFYPGRANVDDELRRYWMPFGEYTEAGNLNITVEINVPTALDSRRLSGFLARDTETGFVYLMHDGGIGGGRRGVGRNAFLAWSDAKPLRVADAAGRSRLGIVVAPVAAPADGVARFIQAVSDFKEAVRHGEISSVSAQQAQRTYQEYYDEPSGNRKRRRIDEIEYISRHGDIVRALQEWRRHTRRSTEQIIKNAYIDLGVQLNGVLTELYEVKTNCSRQTLYSAIGQIMVHDSCSNGSCKRFVALPSAERIAEDIQETLERLGISVLQFELRRNKVRIISQ